MADRKRAPSQSNDVVAREWPALRAAIIDIAAAMDRLDRAGAAAKREQAERALSVLLEVTDTPDRAERVLTHLSRVYDATWHERFAAGQTSPDPENKRA